MNEDIILDYDIMDVPDKRDYPVDELIEQANGESTESIEYKRPYKDIVLFDQRPTNMCTWFASDIACRSYDLLEDIANTGKIVREQVNPLDRYTDTGNHWLQSRLSEYKAEGRIAGYTSIPKRWSKERRLDAMKEALKLGPLYTGTSYTKWTMRQDSLLSLGKTKYKGHAFTIVDYVDGEFKFVNSFSTERGQLGYGYIKEEEIDKLFTCYLLIDKKQDKFFKNFEKIQKAKQCIKEFKGLYAMGDEEVNRYLEEIQITKNLEEKLGFKY